jgi:hypothetical protein
VHWTFDFAPAFLGVAVGCFVDAEFPPPDYDIQTNYRHHWVPKIPGAEEYGGFAPRGVFPER